MSAGRFERSFYSTDDANIMPVRVQPETIAATVGGVSNDAPDGPATGNFGSASVSQGRRTNGVNTRLVRLAFTGDTAPTGYLEGGTITLPALQPAFFAACSVGATGTYLGSAVVSVGRSGETIR